MTALPNKDAEQAVRDYLAFLSDPESLVDPAEIAGLELAAKDATDPIEKLKALSALDRARHPNGDHLRTRFVEVAAGWAKSQDITPAALTEIGVPRTDLQEAGLLGSTTRKTRGPRTSSGKAHVRIEAVQAVAMKQREPFTVDQLREASGASPATVKNALAGMLGTGEIVDLGPDPNHNGRGRAPKMFAQAAASP